MSQCDCEQEKLTEEDLTYLKIAIALFHVNLEMKEDMPKAWAAMQPSTDIYTCSLNFLNSLLLFAISIKTSLGLNSIIMTCAKV